MGITVRESWDKGQWNLLPTATAIGHCPIVHRFSKGFVSFFMLSTTSTLSDLLGNGKWILLKIVVLSYELVLHLAVDKRISAIYVAKVYTNGYILFIYLLIIFILFVKIFVYFLLILYEKASKEIYFIESCIRNLQSWLHSLSSVSHVAFSLSSVVVKMTDEWLRLLYFTLHIDSVLWNICYLYCENCKVRKIKK
jgi:hypothetical protein